MYTFEFISFAMNFMHFKYRSKPLFYSLSIYSIDSISQCYFVSFLLFKFNYYLVQILLIKQINCRQRSCFNTFSIAISRCHILFCLFSCIFFVDFFIDELNTRVPFYHSNFNKSQSNQL